MEKRYKYCVVCGKDYGPAWTQECCTPNSLVTTKRGGTFKKRIEYFSLDGQPLTEDVLAEMRKLETARAEQEKSQRPIKQPTPSELSNLSRTSGQTATGNRQAPPNENTLAEIRKPETPRAKQEEITARPMRIFEVYASPWGVEAVKKGFSWPGFFFGAIWAFVKKLWFEGFSLIVAAVTLRIFENLAEANDSLGLSLIAGLLYLALSLFVGFDGNRWRCSKLMARGYTLKATVEAADLNKAIAQARTAIIRGRAPRDVKDFYCDLCEKAFSNSAETLHHLSSIHGMRASEARQHVRRRWDLLSQSN